MAGTLALDEIVRAARASHAKALLVGDFAQIGAIEAGSALSLIVHDRGGRAAELTDVRRLYAEWEREASLALRLGDEEAIDSYEAHARIVGGEREQLLDALHAAWKADVDAGKSSVMIAGHAGTVAELNRRAWAGRVADGDVAPDGVAMSAGGVVGVGDEVFTRQNDRSLSTGCGFVKSGDRFVVKATNSDGSIAARRSSGGREIILPAAYVAEHLELACATTGHRSQGRTTDAAHVVVSPAMTRELLYVAATRGREANRLYVEITYDPDPATGHDAPHTPAGHAWGALRRACQCRSRDLRPRGARPGTRARRTSRRLRRSTRPSPRLPPPRASMPCWSAAACAPMRSRSCGRATLRAADRVPP